MFNVGDRVEHINDPGFPGTIIQIDSYENFGDVTTCTVQWDDGRKPDIQWTNKLSRSV